MLHGSFALGRLAGINIRAHYTWGVAFLFVALSTSRAWFPASAPGLDSTTYALMGVGAALLLFVSALLHELSHAFVARARGQAVRGVTLFVLDGFSSTDEPSDPADELLISIVGPLSSFAIAGVCWTIEQAWLTPGTPVGGLVAYLALINLLLGAFNLLPCLPLDGGRVLRSLIWRYTGSRVHATRITAGVGQLLAVVFIGLGMSQVFAGQTFNGIWLGVIGWFLAAVTGRTQRQQDVHAGLRGMRVADLMDARPAYAAPDMTVEEFVLEHALRGGRLELVVLEAGRLAGIVTVAGARALAQERWSTTPVARIMNRAPPPVLAPDANVSDVLPVLAGAPFAQIPVVRDGWVIGMLGRADVARFMRLSGTLHLRERRWHTDAVQRTAGEPRRS